MRIPIQWFLSFALVCAGAHANLLTNGSFENPASSTSPSVPLGSTYLTGWTVIDADIAQLRNADWVGVIAASDGSYSLDLTGYHDNSPYGGVSQTISTAPGGVYNLTFDISAINGTTSVTFSAGSASGTASVTSGSTSQVWNTINEQFTATSASTTIQIAGLAASDNGIYIGLDNVTLSAVSTAATPEPSTVLMVLPLLIGFAKFRRKLS